MTSEFTAAVGRRGPYPGLMPFAVQDSEYFFGRRNEARILVANLYSSPLTIVYGPSGVGKSSLLEAGVLHELIDDSNALPVMFRQWSGDPVRDLCEQIARATKRAVHDWQDPGADATLRDYCKKSISISKKYLMLVLDQFEEYFLYQPSGSEFEEAMGDLLSDSGLPVTMMVSIREDSIARLDRFNGTIPGLLDNILRIEHLNRDGGRAAIEKPLARFGSDHGLKLDAEAELIEVVLEEVSAGKIQLSAGGGGFVPGAAVQQDLIEAPYLQLVMEQVWEVERGKGSSVLRASTLRGLGGVGQAVRCRVGTILDQNLSADDQPIAADLFYYLVTPNWTKIAWSAEDLASYTHHDGQDVARILSRLTESDIRVLRPVQDLSGGSLVQRYEASHDILARAILEWRDQFEQRKKELSETQLRRLNALRNRVESFEEQKSAEDPLTAAAVYEIRGLAREAESIDPDLADKARQLEIREDGPKVEKASSRYVKLLERRQIGLLREESRFARREGLEPHELELLFDSRLQPLLRSNDDDVAREAKGLLFDLYSTPSAESTEQIDGLTSGEDSVTRSIGSRGQPLRPSVGSAASGAWPPTSGLPDWTGDSVEPKRRYAVYRHWGFWLFLLVVPALNFLPLVLAGYLLGLIDLPGYGEIAVDALVWDAVITSIIWTGFHFYEGIDDYDVSFVATPFVPWWTAISRFEWLSGWPLNQLVPWLAGALAAFGAGLLGSDGLWPFLIGQFFAFALCLAMYSETTLMVFSWNRLWDAFRSKD